MQICSHLDCLEQELCWLSAVEFACWEHSSGDVTRYLELIASFADWLNEPRNDSGGPNEKR